MKNSDQVDRLKEAVQLCKIHVERMSFAYEKTIKLFPLTEEKFILIEPEELSFIDQLIFRFSKLQDCMGGKLFPAILENLGEEIIGVPFIDILSKLEKLNLLENTKDWLLLRETRNIVTHEYPFVTKEVIDGLNLLSKHYLLILSIWEKMEVYIAKRFSIVYS
jgi:hypothetical protein